MKIVIASKNPVKIESTLAAFQKVFPNQAFEIKGVSVPSEVNDQPMSDEETQLGAYHRTMNALSNYPFADYWVGIEGGIIKRGSQMETFAWVYIMSEEMSGRARTAGFFLPPKVVELINEGMELGEADDIVFGTSNSKQKMGAAGLLTGNIIHRRILYEPAIVLALIPFKNKDLYSEL